MKASELTKANIGDTILVRGVVRDVDSSSIQVRVRSKDGGDFWLYFENEVEIVERAKVGDEVLCYGDRCIIRAIDGEEAWVLRQCDQARLSVKTSNLKRVAS